MTHDVLGWPGVTRMIRQEYGMDMDAEAEARQQIEELTTKTLELEAAVEVIKSRVEALENSLPRRRST